ncbi:WecB/TagA/CpsF family glycosyltransferase [Conexibacter sp. W3-3-2]|uniref:Glycosyltransferase n=1 Tax=Paraconexibacter algicola TaxID=2133960 RepID=A0A2T4UKT9_9ACTN|nr:MULTISPECIES: WecB/TagA/CpsF family glycosyltransferase [Solirubrobacterales]MTD46185.1 WecB/TagA/CpsF family glycosyltransferase [Conexibacter sp. W3-3-2]PTL59859.1 glycosyltransferase [Paraconexibacter algicola]
MTTVIDDATIEVQDTRKHAHADTPARSNIFEIPVDLAEPADLLRRITGWVGDGQGPRRVMYVNAHVLNQSHAIPALRRALESSDLVYCDGYGVRLAAKAMDTEIPHRMTGADWVWGLASLCESAGQSIYLLGSEPGVAAEATRRLRRWYPGLNVVGTHHGYFEPGSAHDERVVEDINAKRPDIVLVGMGSPKQELWVERNAHLLDTDVVWTVGALFDYVSGRVPRAPAWLADNGLEWIFRLAIEPQRMWRRYLLGNPQFVGRVMAQARSRHDHR